MSTLNTDKPADDLPSNGLDALRLPVNYGATLGVQKLLTAVPVGKPRSSEFFRAHRDDSMTFSAMVFDKKESGETYLIAPNVAQLINELVRPVRLHAVIDRQDNMRLVPLPLPPLNGNLNPWHESLAIAIEHAKEKWIRLSANRSLGRYEVFEATADLPEPTWPSHSIEKLVEVAFAGKIITTPDHPIVQSLLGRL